jgi:hypothetical protein
MNFDLLLENIKSSLTIFLTRYHRCSSKSDLEILKTPLNSFLLSSFSIGFKGQELSHSHLHLTSFGQLHLSFNRSHNPTL